MSYVHNLTTKICPIKMKYFSTYYNIPFLYMWIGSNPLLSMKKSKKKKNDAKDKQKRRQEDDRKLI